MISKVEQKKKQTLILSTMNISKNTFEDFPDSVLEKWQNIADLLAETIGVPAALIMKADHEFMEVFISSHSENNPYQAGAKVKGNGHYCETVLKTQNKLSISNATKDKIWNKNPDLKLGMIAYLGFPINFPDNQPFGTLCVLDNKERPFTQLNEKLIEQFKNVIELDLALLQSFELKTNHWAANLVHEIAERKKAEEAFENSELRFRNLLQDVKNLAVQGYAPDGTTTYWNKASELLYGFTAQEAIGRNLLDLIIPAEMKDDVSSAIKWMVESGQPIPSSELILQRKDGSLVSVYSNHTLVKVPGRQQELFCIDIDLTERKQAEEKLKESEQHYRTLFDQANEGLILLTMDGKIADLNQSFAQMHGYTVDEMKNMDIKNLDVLREGAFAEREAVMQRLLAGEVVRFEVEHYHKKGHSFFMNDTVSVVTIAGQQYFLAFHQDITERKQAEQELITAKLKAEESDQLKSAFLANMSHEIRTPMNGILGFLELLNNPDLESEEQQAYIKIIRKSGERLLNIISEIIDISKIEAGQIGVHLQEININDKIENTYNLFKLDAENKGLNLSFKNSLPDNELIIITDKHLLYSILTNLIKNAIKYTDKGSVEFGYEIVENMHDLPILRFYVKDTGIGIPKDRQDAIFERFIQADIADVQARQGAGLGLSIAKAYVEILGGRIWVENEPGQGSIFYFTLPYKMRKKEKVDIKNVVSNSIEGILVENLKILIVEDDEVSELLIVNLVKPFSKKMIRTHSGLEAIEICRNNTDIDLILMDIRIPDLNGYEVTRQIRGFNTDVVIIAQTAFGLTGDREKAIEAGCNDHLSKPINKDQLQALIQTYFNK